MPSAGEATLYCVAMWRPYGFWGWGPDQKWKIRYQSNIIQRCLLVELFERFNHFGLEIPYYMTSWRTRLHCDFCCSTLVKTIRTITLINVVLQNNTLQPLYTLG